MPAGHASGADGGAVGADDASAGAAIAGAAVANFPTPFPAPAAKKEGSGGSGGTDAEDVIFPLEFMFVIFCSVSIYFVLAAHQEMHAKRRCASLIFYASKCHPRMIPIKTRNIRTPITMPAMPIPRRAVSFPVTSFFIVISTSQDELMIDITADAIAKK